MAWIEVHQTIRDHRKVLAVAVELELEEAHVIGMLVSLWLWCLDNAPNGALNGISPRIVARAALWRGDCDKLVQVLINAGFIEKTERGLEIRNWEKYGGKLQERRKIEAAKARERRAATSDNSSDNSSSVGPTSEQRRHDVGPTSEQRRHDVGATSVATLQYTRVDNTTVENTDDAFACDVKKSKSERTKTSTEATWFEDFWQAYPKKVGKKAAEVAWKKVKVDKPLHEKILQAVEKAKRSKQWMKDGGQFIPNPATWLNQGRWEDEPEVAVSNRVVAQGGKYDELESIRRRMERNGVLLT